MWTVRGGSQAVLPSSVVSRTERRRNLRASRLGDEAYMKRYAARSERIRREGLNPLTAEQTPAYERSVDMKANGQQVNQAVYDRRFVEAVRKDDWMAAHNIVREALGAKDAARHLAEQLEVAAGQVAEAQEMLADLKARKQSFTEQLRALPTDIEPERWRKRAAAVEAVIG